MQTSLINLTYLAASVLLIFGLKGLAHPRSAVRGNLLGAAGMFLAVVATLLYKEIISYEVILAGFVAGSFFGIVLALRIRMTAMPQLVALFNGFGGGASVLVASGAFITAIYTGSEMNVQFTISAAASGIIGAVTFWGSLIAFGKLQGIISEKPLLFPGRHFINGLLVIIAGLLGGCLAFGACSEWTYWLLIAVSSVLGILLLLPIGGADMPVAIALLNSYSGLAATATGFVLDNNMLIIAGSLVGASGVILTSIMCKAMNRSLANVLFGGIGAVSSRGPDADDVYAGKIKSTSAEEIALMLDGARRVVFVPGYGMAVAQAQHAVRDLGNLLENSGTEVEYAIHPVAGRMPGHMNVLLAEADVSYDKLKEMDVINPTMEQVDIAIVIGANDVVNPAAREPDSVISGMPVINVDKAKTVIVIKRSLSPGFAGIPNPLFTFDNTIMFFSDGKKALLEIISAVKG